MILHVEVCRCGVGLDAASTGDGDVPYPIYVCSVCHEISPICRCGLAEGYEVPP